MKAPEALARAAGRLVEHVFAARCEVDGSGNGHVSGLPVDRVQHDLGLTMDGAGRYYSPACWRDSLATCQES
jgi:hypothetical protein